MCDAIAASAPSATCTARETAYDADGAQARMTPAPPPAPDVATARAASHAGVARGPSATMQLLTMVRKAAWRNRAGVTTSVAPAKVAM